MQVELVSVTGFKAADLLLDTPNNCLAYVTQDADVSSMEARYLCVTLTLASCFHPVSVKITLRYRCEQTNTLWKTSICKESDLCVHVSLEISCQFSLQLI